MFFIILLLLQSSTTAAKSYDAYATDDAYHFDVFGYGLKAQIYKGRRLGIRGPRFSRIWDLPDDANAKLARTFKKGNVFQVFIPKFKPRKLQGGEVPRGTTVHFAASHVCATFDGSEPVCGTPCKHGNLLKDFVVSEDEVVLKLKTCQLNNQPETVIYHAYDTDITNTEEDYEYPPEIIGKHGWFDRHGNERSY